MSSPDGASFGYGSPRAEVTSRRATPLRSIDWTRLALTRLLRRVVRTGRLVVHLADAEPIVVGDGSNAEAVTIRLRDARTAWRLVLSPELALGETYMDGDLVVEGGEIGDLLDLLARNVSTDPRRRASPAARLWERLAQANGRLAARRNVAHHYDLSLELYRRFLDEDLQYSCAYFARPDMTLDEAQAAKKRHIAAKLRLAPGQRVLDIGCGWGGLALSLAEEAGARVTGVTLSREQLATARSRAQARGLDDQVEFRLEDYRDVQGTFDRIVSVGMFEHVGAPNYQAYFDGVARLLADDGVALIHSIGVANRVGTTQPWIAKYIFPGGHIPALSEVLPAIERAGLWVTDIEILRLHYAETLKAWRARFAAHRDEIAALYDERFCRMWEFYLNLSEVGFRRRGCMVFQIQLAKRVDALPIVRDYMSAA
ncbi:class I SAM-dependent methyltransferase [Caulobacter sp. LARHSG274]